MAEIRLRDGESIENALRRFKRQVLNEDIIKETKRHSYYLKPGQEAMEVRPSPQTRPQEANARAYA